MDLQLWLSIEGIAEYLGDSKGTVCLWLERKKVSAHRVGRLWVFKASEVVQWIIAGGTTTNDKQQG